MKMTTNTTISQEELLTDTKTVTKGLETLKSEHNGILGSLLESLKSIKKEGVDSNLVEEKAAIIRKSLEQIELGLGEAQ
ncbi:KLC1, partial [Branchiostoma lanceolatum]